MQRIICVRQGASHENFSSFSQSWVPTVRSHLLHSSHLALGRMAYVAALPIMPPYGESTRRLYADLIGLSLRL